MIYVGFVYALFFFTVLFASKCGGRPERSAAAMYVAALLATNALQSAFNSRFDGVEIGLLAVDATLLAGLVGLLVWTNRTWPIAAIAFQAVSTLAHLARLLDPSFDRFAYALMESMSAVPTALALLVGTALHQRRQRSI